MKKILYFILLAVELFFDVIMSLSLLGQNLGIVCIVVVALTAALIAWQVVRFVKSYDPAVKSRALLLIALFGILPAVAGVLAYVVIAIVLIFAFA